MSNPSEAVKRPTTTVYVTVGNSDNRLTQNEWAHFVATVRHAIHRHAWVVHIEAFTEPSSARQSACWGMEVFTDDRNAEELKDKLRQEAGVWHQDEIVWAPAQVEMLTSSF